MANLMNGYLYNVFSFYYFVKVFLLLYLALILFRVLEKCSNTRENTQSLYNMM